MGPAGEVRKYPIGTSITVPVNDNKYILVASTHTDLVSNKSFATVQDMWQALLGLWQEARIATNGEALCVPLIGSGHAGIGLPPQHLLQLIVMSILHETRQKRICSDIEIVLHESLFDDIDLSQLRFLVN